MYLNGNYILVNGTTIKTTNKNIKKDLEKLGYKEDK